MRARLPARLERNHGRTAKGWNHSDSQPREVRPAPCCRVIARRADRKNIILHQIGGQSDISRLLAAISGNSNGTQRAAENFPWSLAGTSQFHHIVPAGRLPAVGISARQETEIDCDLFFMTGQVELDGAGMRSRRIFFLRLALTARSLRRPGRYPVKSGKLGRGKVTRLDFHLCDIGPVPRRIAIRSWIGPEKQPAAGSIDWQWKSKRTVCPDRLDWPAVGAVTGKTRFIPPDDRRIFGNEFDPVGVPS